MDLKAIWEMSVNRVRVPKEAAHMFANRVIDRVVTGELATDTGICLVLIGCRIRLAVNLSHKNRNAAMRALRAVSPQN